jgi:hypothetical protein
MHICGNPEPKWSMFCSFPMPDQNNTTCIWQKKKLRGTVSSGNGKCHFINVGNIKRDRYLLYKVENFIVNTCSPNLFFGNHIKFGLNIKIILFYVTVNVNYNLQNIILKVRLHKA